MNKNIVKDQSAQVGQGAHSSMSNNKTSSTQEPHMQSIHKFLGEIRVQPNINDSQSKIQNHLNQLKKGNSQNLDCYQINNLFYNMQTMVSWMRYELGIYLDDNCRTTTFQIAKGILQGTHFSLPCGIVQVGQISSNVSNIDIYEQLRQSVPQELSLEWKLTRLPDRQQLINCLKTVQPNHSYFKPLQIEDRNLLPKEQFSDSIIAATFNLNKYRKGKKSNLLRLSQDQRDQIRNGKVKRKIERKNKRLTTLRNEIKKIEEKIQIYQDDNNKDEEIKG